MKSIFYSIISVCFLCFSCSTSHDGFIVKGIVKGGKGKNIFLSYDGQVDSTLINSDNEFIFKGTLREPNFCNLYLDRTNPILLFIDSTSNITIEIETDAENFSSNYSVKGSLTSQQIKELHSRLIETFDNIKTLYKNTIEIADSSTMDSLHTYFSQKSNELVNQHKEFIANFIKNNPKSFAILPAIYQAFDSRNPVFRYEIDAPLFHLVDSLFMTHYPNSIHTKEFHAQILQYKQQYQSLFQAQQFMMQNAEAPDFTIQTKEGKTFKLSSLKGKYVFLDFWASWCKPCRAENPNLVDVYKKFKKYPIQFVQISLDNNKEQWLKAIEADQIGEWTHASNLKYWDCQVAKLYGVQAIPANFLIDPNGKIIAQNLRGDQLFATLAEIFHSKGNRK
ncbi:MAG: AhpC/TSA family protein [Bacteroidales bacterium]|nr:AhpC/TSA family protein [Bacteroidales bacterium]